MEREIKRAKDEIARLEREVEHSHKIRQLNPALWNYDLVSEILLEQAKKKLGFLDQMKKERETENEAQ